MKKIVVILAAFILALFVVSCGGDSGNSDTNPTEEPTNPTEEPTNPTEEPTNPTEEPTNPTDPTDEPTNPTDPTDEPTNPTEGCTEGETRLGETVCGSTQHGKLYQICKDGDWEDTEKCTCDPGEYPEVCGYYGQKMWFTSTSKVPLVGDLAEGWTRTYFHIVQEQEQEKVHIKATYCNIKIDNSASSILQIIMPQSFADALGTADKESVMAKREDGTFDFTQDVFWEIRGIDPNCYGNNPAGYTLPTNQNDPCVQDWDNDGMPGLTLNAKSLTTSVLSIVEKSSSTIYDGNVSEDGLKINALVSWTDEQKVLYAENSMLKTGSENQIKDNSDKFDGIANFIEQVKIEDGSDCAYIVNNAATIFSPDPVTLK